MSAVILLRDGENRASLSNSLIARLVDIDTGWNKIRAGILFQINGGATLTSPDIALGFCAGTTNCYGDATVTHFVGAVSDSNWTFGGSWYSGLTLDPAKKVGVTKTNGTALTAGAVARGDVASSTVRSMLFVDITKGSPNFTFELFYRNALDTGGPPSEVDFLAQMEQPIPAFAHHTLSGTQTLAVDEGVDGTLDAFQAFWSPAAQLVEISTAAVAILS